MTPLAFALAMFLVQPADAPAAAEAPAPTAEAAPAPIPATDDFPAGAPHDDYQFVAWRWGNLRGYLDMHDEVMPEVTRIEYTYRPPHRQLSEKMQVHCDIHE